MSARGTTNANARGSATNRRSRKQWLLDTWGDGNSAPCRLTCSPSCLRTVTLLTISVDRIIPGTLGGTYARNNIRPACLPCNITAGIRLRDDLRKGAQA